MTAQPPLPPPSREPSAAPVSNSDWAAARGDKWRAQLGGMEAMLAPVDAPLLKALRLDAPCRIAEIGAGGGGTALAILRAAPAGSVVHGFDISPGLVEVARARIPAAASAIGFQLADAATSRPDAPYDRLVSRFGVMFFEAPEAAFANLLHWLVPGGRFAFAVWGPASDNPWMTSVREVVAHVIDLPPTDPEAPGAFRYAQVERLLGLLEQSGFGELEARDFRSTLALGGGMPADQAASFALAAFSSFGELLAQATRDAFEQARRALTTRLAQYEHEQGVHMAARVHIVTGTRPV